MHYCKKEKYIFRWEMQIRHYAAMITQFLPVGLKGLAIAGLLSALMSSLSSAFNSSSTLLTIDFYQKYKPNASQKDLVRFGQIATLALVVVSLSWIPFMKSLMSGGIFHYLQSVQAYISPPIAAVFLFGLFFKWINSKGAIITLWVGFVIGVFRLVAEFLNNDGVIVVSENSILGMFLGINFLHFALFLFLFCGVILMLVSKLYPCPIPEELDLITFKNRDLRSKFKWSRDMILTVVLIALVLFLWFLFSTWGMANI